LRVRLVASILLALGWCATWVEVPRSPELAQTVLTVRAGARLSLPGRGLSPTSPLRVRVGGEPLRGVVVFPDRIEGFVARDAALGSSSVEIRAQGSAVAPVGRPRVIVEPARIVVPPRASD
jgi:hypothetical protein